MSSDGKRAVAHIRTAERALADLVAGYNPNRLGSGGVEVNVETAQAALRKAVRCLQVAARKRPPAPSGGPPCVWCNGTRVVVVRPDPVTGDPRGFESPCKACNGGDVSRETSKNPGGPRGRR